MRDATLLAAGCRRRGARAGVRVPPVGAGGGPRRRAQEPHPAPPPPMPWWRQFPSAGTASEELVVLPAPGMESRITFTLRLYEHRRGLLPFRRDRLLVQKKAERSAFWDFLDDTFVVESEDGTREILRERRGPPAGLPDPFRALPLRCSPRQAPATTSAPARCSNRSASCRPSPSWAWWDGRPPPPRRGSAGRRHEGADRPRGADGEHLARPFHPRAALRDPHRRHHRLLPHLRHHHCRLGPRRGHHRPAGGPGPPLVLLGVTIFQFVRLLRQRALRQSGAGLRLRLLLFFTLISVLSAGPQAMLGITFVNSAMGTWFSSSIGDSLRGARDSAIAYQKERLLSLRSFVDGPLTPRLVRDFASSPDGTWSEVQAVNAGIGALQLFGPDGKELTSAGTSARGSPPQRAPAGRKCGKR